MSQTFYRGVGCVDTDHYGESINLTLSHQVPRTDLRGVHLAALFLRGMSVICEVNGACGQPLNMNNLMPWRFFDGKLFHVKYLMSQEGASVEQLCDGNVSQSSILCLVIEVRILYHVCF